MECLFLTDQCLFIFVLRFAFWPQPQPRVSMACLYIVSINVHRRCWPWLCVRVSSALPAGAPAPARPRSSGHLLLALGTQPCSPGPGGGRWGQQFQAWHPRGPWAEGVRASDVQPGLRASQGRAGTRLPFLTPTPPCLASSWGGAHLLMAPQPAARTIPAPTCVSRRPSVRSAEAGVPGHLTLCL